MGKKLMYAAGIIIDLLLMGGMLGFLLIKTFFRV